MKKRILILITINIVTLFIVYIVHPQCEPCIEGVECPLCISNEQIALLAGLLIVDVFYIIKYFIKR